jgi:hypothetical protein
MGKIIQNGDQVYSTGVYLTRNENIPGGWHVDSFTDPTFHNGEEVNDHYVNDNKLVYYTGEFPDKIPTYHVLVSYDVEYIKAEIKTRHTNYWKLNKAYTDQEIAIKIADIYKPKEFSTSKDFTDVLIKDDNDWPEIQITNIKFLEVNENDIALKQFFK